MRPVPNSLLDVIISPQPPGAAMPRPSFSVRHIQSGVINVATRVSLKGIHTNLRLHFSLNHYVHMIGSNVRGAKFPVSVFTNLA